MSAGGCGASRPAGRAGRAGAPTVAVPARVRSNILRADYAGSARCASCHAEITAAWRASPMHLMTRLPEGARIRAPFDGATFRFKDDSARLTEKDGDAVRRADVGERRPSPLPRHPRHRRSLPRGLRRASRSARAPPTSERELILPISYVFETKSFRLKGYSVMVTERPGLHAGGVWNQTCVFCHNTVPYFDDVWGALLWPRGAGLPGRGGRPAAAARPPVCGSRWRDGGGAGRRGRRRGDAPSAGAPPLPERRRAEALKRGIRELRARFGGAPLRRGRHRLRGLPRRQPRARRRSARAPATSRRAARSWTARPEVARTDGEVTRAEWINRACARCHQVLFSRYPFTWEGGQRRGDDPGGSSINSGEGRDFLLGGCARQMACVDLPRSARRGSARRARAAGHAGAATRVCIRCHAQYAAPAALAAHAHHDPDGAGGSLRRLPHAAQEHGARLRAHPLPPDRPPRRSGARRARPPARVRALPRRQDGRRSGRHDGALVGPALRSRRAAAALRRARRPRRSAATLARGKPHEQAVGAGHAGRGARDGGCAGGRPAAASTRSRWCATTRGARWRRCAGRTAPSISIGRRRRSRRRCAPACQRRSRLGRRRRRAPRLPEAADDVDED